MKTIIYLSLILCLWSISSLCIAQCNDHEAALNVTFITGALGGDTQWSITDDQTGETYANSDFGAYDDHDTIQTLVCVPAGAALTLTVTCCFNNDGSFFLELFGDTIATASVFQFDNTYSFVATPALERDVSVTAVAIQKYALTKPHEIKGTLQNLAGGLIHSLDLHWQIDNSVIQSESLTNLNIEPFSAFEFTHPTVWEAQEGAVELKVWASNINGGADQQTANDVWQQDIQVRPVLGDRIVLLESFTNASCNACAFVDMDLVVLILGNLNRIAPINYHTSFPGFDPMYWDNPTDAMGRTNYYQEIKPVGTPTTIAEGGRYFGGTGQFELFQIGQFKSDAALFSFALNEQTLSSASDTTIIVDAYVTSHIPINEEDIRLFVVITEELIEFEGGAGNNGVSDFYYVMRQMLPNFSGQQLQNLQIDEPQHYQFAYPIPNHVQPEQLRTIVFVQNNETQEVYQAFRTDQASGTYRGSSLSLVGTNFGQVEVIRQPPSCWDSKDGSIRLQAIASDGSTDFSYTWNTGETGQELSQLAGGSYTVQINGSNGQSDEITLTLPSSTVVLETVVIDDKDGLGTGEATVLIANEDQFTPTFAYQWSNGQTTATATNLTTGTYQVTVTSFTGCQQIEEVTINNVISSNLTTEINHQLNLYPNPSTQTTLLQLPTVLRNQPMQLEVFNSAGQLVLTENRMGEQTYLLNISGWESGLYWVRVVGQQNSWAEQLVVIK